MAYAAREDVLAFPGELVAKAFDAGAGEALGEAIDKAILKASYEMDAVFARSSYQLPLVPPADEAQALELAAKLAHICVVLAIWFQVAHLTNLPPGFLEAKADAAAWLNAILEGTENLLGIDRVDVEAEKLAAGRIGFAGSGRPNPFPPRVFRQWGNLSGFGISGEREERF